jgi:hypothetical protein
MLEYGKVGRSWTTVNEEGSLSRESGLALLAWADDKWRAALAGSFTVVFEDVTPIAAQKGGNFQPRLAILSFLFLRVGSIAASENE